MCFVPCLKNVWTISCAWPKTPKELQPITKAITTLIKVKLKVLWTLRNILSESLKSDLCVWLKLFTFNLYGQFITPKLLKIISDVMKVCQQWRNIKCLLCVSLTLFQRGAELRRGNEFPLRLKTVIVSSVLGLCCLFTQ